MNNAFTVAMMFLVKTFFDFYIFLMILRVILQWVHASISNPLVVAIFRMTQPPLQFIRRFIPTYRGFDFGAIVILLFLEIVKLIILIKLDTGVFPSIPGLGVLAFAEILDNILNIYFYCLLFFVIISWVPQLYHSPIGGLLFQITDPILAPARRLIPPISGLDISVIPVMVGLKLVQILITNPLLAIGARLAIASLY